MNLLTLFARHVLPWPEKAEREQRKAEAEAEREKSRQRRSEGTEVRHNIEAMAGKNHFAQIIVGQIRGGPSADQR